MGSQVLLLFKDVLSRRLAPFLSSCGEAVGGGKSGPPGMGDSYVSRFKLLSLNLRRISSFLLCLLWVVSVDAANQITDHPRLLEYDHYSYPYTYRLPEVFKGQVRRIQQTEYYADTDEDGSIVYKQWPFGETAVEFDLCGRITYNYHHRGGSIQEYSYSYNNKGQLVSLDDENQGNNVKFHYRGDTLRVIIWRYIEDYDEKFYLRTYYYLPSAVSYLGFHPSGKQFTYYERTYDDKGRLVKIREYPEKGPDPKDELTYEYNEDDLIVYSLKIFDGDRRTEMWYTYDDNGQPVEVLHHDWPNDKLKSIFQYVYDEHGNWIERKESRNGNPYELITREIEYY